MWFPFRSNNSAAPVSHRKRPASHRTLGVEGLEHRDLMAVILASNFASLQAAIDSAAANIGADTVVIPGGSFTQNLTIQDMSPLTLRGTLGANPTRIIGGAGAGITVSNSAQVTLENMQVIGGQRGVSGQNLGTLTLKNMNLSSNLLDGLAIGSSTELIVVGGQYRNNGGTGIATSDVANVKLTSPQVSGNALEGVDIDETVSGTVLLAKVFGGGFFNNGDDGVELQGATIDVLASTVSGNMEDGIQITGGGEISLRSVISVDNKEEGVDIDNVTGTARIVGSTVNRNGDAAGEDGLNARNVGTLIVSGGNFTGNFAVGIKIQAASNVSISTARAASNGEHGLSVRDADQVAIRGGSFTLNARHGILIEGSQADPIGAADVASIQATNNQGNGLKTTWVRSLSIGTSQVLDNLENGMQLHNSEAITLTAVNCLRNHQDGVEIVGRSGLGGPTTVVTLVRGSYSNNRVDGIDIQLVGPVTLDRTVGYRNLDDGVEIFDSGTVTMPLAVFRLNGGDDVSIV